MRCDAAKEFFCCGNRCAHTPVRIQKTHRDRIIGQTHADETATDGIKPYETVRKTVRRNFSFPVITKKTP